MKTTVCLILGIMMSLNLMNIVEAKTTEDVKAYEIEKAANFRVLFHQKFLINGI